MEGEELNYLYQILESSSHFWSPSTSIDGLLSPQNCNISPYQNLDTIVTNPPPPLVVDHQNDVVNVVMPQPQTEFLQQLMSENLISDSGVEQAVPNKRGKPKQKKKEKQKQKEREDERETWYKGPWTKSEDRKLSRLVLYYGFGAWAKIARHMGGRIGKQCRERWHNNLRPNIWKSIVWSDEEEMMIIEGHKRFGNRWSAIARFIPGRSENAVKNHWNAIKRRQFSKKRISRPRRLRRLYQSTVLENYIRKKFLINTGLTSSAAADAPLAAAANTPLPICENNPLFAIFSTTTPITAATTYIPTVGDSNDLIATFSTTPSAAFTPPPIAATINENYNALIPNFSTTFTPPPITTLTENYAAFSSAAATTFITSPPSNENYNDLIPTFSTSAAAATFTPPPITTLTENNAAFSSAATTFSPPPLITFTENNATFSSAATTFAPPPLTKYTDNDATFSIAATTFTPPPITTSNENYNALIPTFFTTAAAATTFTPPPITTITENDATFTTAATTFTPPPLTTSTETNALAATDLPLSVDDYDIDGIPYFTFESAIDETFDLMLPSFTFNESAIDENVDFMQNMYTGLIESPIIADSDYAAATSYLTAETVDEEMDFLRSLFGNNGEM